jgi:hypothetical protein
MARAAVEAATASLRGKACELTRVSEAGAVATWLWPPPRALVAAAIPDLGSPPGTPFTPEPDTCIVLPEDGASGLHDNGPAVPHARLWASRGCAPGSLSSA